MTFPFKLFMVIKENPPLMPFFLTAQKRLGFFRAIFQGVILGRSRRPVHSSVAHCNLLYLKFPHHRFFNPKLAVYLLLFFLIIIKSFY